MKFFTSRYTASLEEQVKELRVQVATKDRQILELMASIREGFHTSAAIGGVTSVPRICCDGKVNPRSGRFIHAIDCKADKTKPPAAVNWLRARGRLEDPNVKVEEFEPEGN